MLRGQWLAGPYSDQVTAGLPFRGWGAEWWRRLGHVPQWNPEIFGGMPYVGALGTGDILYPTAFLRLIMPTATVINIGFFVHYILAGLFMYLLLRRLQVSWSGAVVGGLAYQLSGLVASYAQPGHDGKLVVTALLPLVLLGLVAGMRDRRLWGYSVTALGIGLSILTQHVQMTYYMLVAAGLFALYLCLGAGIVTTRDRLRVLGIASAAVAVGFGVAAIQLLPVFAHMPLSARAVSVQGGFAGATTYGIPWMHIPEFFLKNFVGWGPTYWGTNGIKLHSEYLGLPVIALALLGAGAETDRRLRLWLAGIGLLFLLIGLGKGTPFYHLWWSVMPYVRQMRAPGMAYFVVVFVVACFAAFGVERLERRADASTCKTHLRAWLIAAPVLALLAVAGVFGGMASALAGGREVAGGDIMFGAVTSAIALAAVAGLVWAGVQGRLAPAQWTIALALVIGADLWVNGRQFWTYSTLHRDLYRPDAVTQRIKATPGPAPARALDLGALLGPPRHPAYPGSVLMAEDIPQLLGEHGIEIRYFDDVTGGQGEWRNLGNLHLWDLFAVRWVIVPAAAQGLDSIPGFTRVLRDAATPTGAAHLFERTAPAPYVRVVSAAANLDSMQVVGTLVDPRMAIDRVVLLDVRDSFPAAPVTTLPPASPARATVTRWEPGRMSIALDPAPRAASFALVAENWYPDWHATVDGVPARVLRGDWTLITVPVPAGAKTVELTFSSRAFRWGKMITWVSLILVLGAVVGPAAWRRRGG